MLCNSFTNATFNHPRKCHQDIKNKQYQKNVCQENLRPIIFFSMAKQLSFLDNKLIMKIFVQSLRPGNCRLTISHPKNSFFA